MSKLLETPARGIAAGANQIYMRVEFGLVSPGESEQHLFGLRKLFLCAEGQKAEGEEKTIIPLYIMLSLFTRGAKQTKLFSDFTRGADGVTGGDSCRIQIF